MNHRTFPHPDDHDQGDDTRQDDTRDTQLESMLDEALSPGLAPPYLAPMIVEKTLPQFTEVAERPSILARIGRPAFRVAAVMAIGALVVLALVNAPSGTWQNPVAVAPSPQGEPSSQEVSLAELDARLALWAQLAQDQAMDTDEETQWDEELELLAMHVEWLNSAPAWHDLSQREAMEEAIAAYQLEVLSAQPMQLF